MKVEVIDWPPTVIVDGKVVYQEDPLEKRGFHGDHQDLDGDYEDDGLDLSVGAVELDAPTLTVNPPYGRAE